MTPATAHGIPDRRESHLPAAPELALLAQDWAWKRVDGSWGPLLYFCKS